MYARRYDKYSEITKNTFYKLLDENVECSHVKEEEHARKHYYDIDDDTVLLSINNFVSCVTQYYIRDINS
tara:strand:- start:233 stop:442 length:210 start_codon:yes stop_codon:yes gene_type:complete